jgi:uncharacterized protein YbbC (DUF1343 family)/CubicO group peptidase (beta-lactamase class C family)
MLTQFIRNRFRFIALGATLCSIASFNALLTPPVAAETPARARLPQSKPADVGMDASQLDAIDKLVEQAISEEKLPGAVVTIGRQGSIVFQRTYGHRQLSPESLPMLKDTVFDLASLTKPIATATSIMRLVELEMIQLDDRVGDHLPEFAVEGKQDVTIKQLLTHVGGLIPDNAMKDYEDGPEASRANFLKLGLNYEPGKRFRYSDVGFQVLGELIKSKTGKSVAEFAEETIFRPLGMHETKYLPGRSLRKRAATTQQREGRWMVGEVHDPRAYAMGGVAGHAGLFGTADDLAVYAQMMLQEGRFGDATILQPETVRMMTAGNEVPGSTSRSPWMRGLGWDKRSPYSSNRGETMSDAAYGHGGFTGTAIWIDPGFDLFVIFLSNRVHPDGKGAVNPLAGEVGAIAVNAIKSDQANADALAEIPQVRCGIDVLVDEQFAALAGRRIGLITNHTGVGRDGTPTRILLHQAQPLELVALLSPEHGIDGRLDQSRIDDSVDPETGLKVFSLYGKDRKPSPESLKGIDTLVFDIQDIGCRFYTYISTMGEAMQVAADHGLRFVVLDRPNPINGIDVAGPVLDAGSESFVAYHTLPVRHGMTVGEIAQMLRAERGWSLDLQVISCDGWRREDFFEASGLSWINPSPNMRNLNQAVLYPGVGLLEYTNLSVGRGTDTPFEIVGAPWIDSRRLAQHLNSLRLPGVAFIPTDFTPNASKFANQPCQGIQILITERPLIEPLQVGLAIAVALRKHHPDQWETKLYNRLLGSQKVNQALIDGKPLDEVSALAESDVEAFRVRRQPYLLY